MKTTPGYKWVTLLHKCLKLEVFYGFFSFESSQAVVSLMSGGGVGVGDRLDTLDTDLVKKVWSKLQEIKTHLCPAEHILITNQEKTGVVYLSQ